MGAAALYLKQLLGDIVFVKGAAAIIVINVFEQPDPADTVLQEGLPEALRLNRILAGAQHSHSPAHRGVGHHGFAAGKDFVFVYGAAVVAHNACCPSRDGLQGGVYLAVREHLNPLGSQIIRSFPGKTLFAAEQLYALVVQQTI